VEASEVVQSPMSVTFSAVPKLSFDYRLEALIVPFIREMAAFLGCPHEDVYFQMAAVDDSHPFSMPGLLMIRLPCRAEQGASHIPPNAVYKMELTLSLSFETGEGFWVFLNQSYTLRQLPELVEAVWAHIMRTPHKYYQI